MACVIVSACRNRLEGPARRSVLTSRSRVRKSISGHQTERMREHYSTVTPDEQRWSIGNVVSLFGPRGSGEGPRQSGEGSGEGRRASGEDALRQSGAESGAEIAAPLWALNEPWTNPCPLPVVDASGRELPHPPRCWTGSDRPE